MNHTSKIKNIVLVGTTGSGKSTTGNMLLTGSLGTPFTVSDDPLSCTLSADHHTDPTKKLHVVDTPGFGDNRFKEEEINKIIKDMTLIIVNPSIDSTEVIDAFLLPTKFNPRPSTLKKDIEYFVDLFGTIALKTLIILPIFCNDKIRNETEVLNVFKGMSEIVTMLKEGKNEELNSNWFCLWDNLKPDPNQEANLMKKIETLQPYTHKKFQEAQNQIKKSIEEEAKKYEEQIAKERQRQADEKAALEERIRQAALEAEEERKRVQKAQEEAQKEAARQLALIEQKKAEQKAEMDRLIALAKQKKDCTLETHGKIPFVQRFYSCLTCKLTGTSVACAECAKECHQGHALIDRGMLMGYCDCRLLTTKCKLQNICTTKLYGTQMIRQQRYTCDTCKMNPNIGEMMCQCCAEKCHQAKGHTIRHLGLVPGYCDCKFKYSFCCTGK